MKKGAKIINTTYYLPHTRFTNEDYYTIFPDSKTDANLEKIGIKERRIVAENELASDLAVHAAEKLFNEHPIDRSDIDFVLFCAQEFDYYTPTTACVIQDRLNLPTSCGALDFNLGCSGFVYGLSIAKGLIGSIGVKNVLLLTSSTLTKTFHPKDKSSRFVFGDAAAATLISASDETDGIGEFIFGTDGHGYDKIIIKDGGARNQITAESSVDKFDDFGNPHSDETFLMKGAAIFNFSVRTVPKMVNDLLEKSALKDDDIDLYIFHQANKFLLQTLQKVMDIPDDKFYIHYEMVGNTVSSTIPIALNEALKEKRVTTGQKVMLVAFGVGLSWSSTIIII
jgi:3-oxoacyl-[acyl-carrier-protein] synthase-3